MRELNLIDGWQVLQDVHETGELHGLFKPDYQPVSGTALSRWEPLPRLAHLQLLFARQPDFGRELRYFNEHPWYYRLEFSCPADAGKVARLRFEGVDYFAKVWLNGQLLGEHEGYSEVFEFPVETIIKRGEKNTLVVKVSAPWDRESSPGREANRVGSVIRNQIKGTYEHCDTFVQRDVNPIGIWRPVKLILSDECWPAGTPHVISQLATDRWQAKLTVHWPVGAASEISSAELTILIEDDETGLVVARTQQSIKLAAGINRVKSELVLPSPKLWNTPDRGGPALYRARLKLQARGETLLSGESVFGVRTVELVRSATETSVRLNSQKLYIRGTTYFPDVYLSRLDRGRYERDLRAMLDVGINAIRIHVHVENPELYALCDRLGILVLQDGDLNWNYPTDDVFTQRAVRVFSAMVEALRGHPCIFAWICTNEAAIWEVKDLDKAGAALEQAAHELDPTRPTIRNSTIEDQLVSGDSHFYDGSLGKGVYTDMAKRKPKLLTEFGADAPASPESLRQVPELARKLAPLLPRIAELHDYQFRLIKYQIENVRIRKYDPCAGYFQFMWIDLCPQSFYGVYDYWGKPKVEGQGGALRAFREANLPIGVFMEHLDTPVAIWAVSDLVDEFKGCALEWSVTTAGVVPASAPAGEESVSGGGEEITRGSAAFDLPPDSRIRVTDLKFPVSVHEKYCVRLSLYDSSGKLLAGNRYDDPFHHPQRRPGYPERIDHETGMRLWDA
ncbi:MAG TPA: glycoside hydrolase family 2 TIM barrel-domain containing protein [Planctomycetota bacterium]|jgi:beta-mannosidase